MILDSSVFPLGGGSTNIAGFEWAEKTTDFTAESNKAYYCDTALNNILITLPTDPLPGDEIAMLMLGVNKVNFITTDKVKGSFLNVDYGKEITDSHVLVILFFDEIQGWDWDTRYNSLIVDSYLGAGTLLPFTSHSTLNGLVNWLGTNKAQTEYQNVYPEHFNFTASIAFVDNPTQQSKVFDKIVYTGSSVVTNGAVGTPVFDSHGIGAYYQVDILTGSIVPNYIFIPLTNNNSSNSRSVTIRGGKNGIYEDIATYSIPAGINDSGRIINYSGTKDFDSFRIVLNYSTTQGLPLSEFEVWGLYYP